MGPTSRVRRKFKPPRRTEGANLATLKDSTNTRTRKKRLGSLRRKTSVLLGAGNETQPKARGSMKTSVPNRISSVATVSSISPDTKDNHISLPVRHPNPWKRKRRRSAQNLNLIHRTPRPLSEDPTKLHFFAPEPNRGSKAIKNQACRCRRVEIPMQFRNINQYKETLSSAVYEDLQLSVLYEVSSRVSKVSFQRIIRNDRSRLKEDKLRNSKKISYYDRVVFQPPHFTWKKRRPQEPLVPQQPRLKILSNREGSRHYSKGDLWIICSDEHFSRRFSKHFYFLYSTYHGPSSEGIVMLEPLSPKKLPILYDKITMHAIRIPDTSTYIDMLESLDALDSSKCPVVKDMLGIVKTVPASRQLHRRQVGYLPKLAIPPGEVEREIESLCATKGLNADQKEVLVTCGGWLYQDERNPTRYVHLVHGPFGSGKSTTLVQSVLMLCRLLENYDIEKQIRILVCGMTNTAVDRILCGLLKEGFTDIARIGSTKKIAKPILEHQYPYAAEESPDSIERTLEDLRELRNESQGLDREYIQRAIDKIKSKKLTYARFRSKRVVGATCKSSMFPSLHNEKFSIVLLDECSQIVEPMVPVTIRHNCEALLACGDPNQLPPVVGDTCQIHKHANQSKLTYKDSLFSRLGKLFHTTFLRTQYRCHPQISGLANHLFYDGKLLDGITEKDRAPILNNLPPVLVYRSPNACQKYGASWRNFGDASDILKIIKVMSFRGVRASQIGVIALYNPQVDLLQRKYCQDLRDKWRERGGDADAIQISTVDAFQGAEKDIIILNTVRDVGSAFTDNAQRINVAVTRARYHLIIVGDCNKRSMDKSSTWKYIFDTALRYGSVENNANKVVSIISRSQRISHNAGKKITGLDHIPTTIPKKSPRNRDVYDLTRDDKKTSKNHNFTPQEVYSDQDFEPTVSSACPSVPLGTAPATLVNRIGNHGDEKLQLSFRFEEKRQICVSLGIDDSESEVGAEEHPILLPSVGFVEGKDPVNPSSIRTGIDKKATTMLDDSDTSSSSEDEVEAMFLSGEQAKNPSSNFHNQRQKNKSISTIAHSPEQNHLAEGSKGGKVRTQSGVYFEDLDSDSSGEVERAASSYTQAKKTAGTKILYQDLDVNCSVLGDSMIKVSAVNPIQRSKEIKKRFVDITGEQTVQRQAVKGDVISIPSKEKEIKDLKNTPDKADRPAPSGMAASSGESASRNEPFDLTIDSEDDFEDNLTCTTVRTSFAIMRRNPNIILECKKLIRSASHLVIEGIRYDVLKTTPQFNFDGSLQAIGFLVSKGPPGTIGRDVPVKIFFHVKNIENV